jgi:hypothetical protein
MKKLIFILFVIVFSSGLFAQSVERFVISPCVGGYFNGSNVIMDYSTGEIAISTLTGASGILTQGFQQPYTFLVAAVNENNPDPVQIEMFPNPAVNEINVIINQTSTGNIHVALYDMLGQVLLNKSAIAEPDGKVKVKLNVAGLATGNYFLKVMDGKNVIVTRKIIKINQ